MAAEPTVTLRLTKSEALALLNAADTGLRVIEALNQGHRPDRGHRAEAT